jgi:hypothetical protein
MKILIGLLLFICTNFAYADRSAYSEIREIKIESRNYSIVHFHNWSKETFDKRYSMINSEHQNILNENNNYAYIKIINKITNEIIVNIPSPALTHLYISKDEQYILGISKIMFYNPYQLIIININGEIIKKRHIVPVEAKMNETEFNIFKNNYTNAFEYLQKNDRIYYVNTYFYIDFCDLNYPVYYGDEAFNYLSNYITENHLSENISSSVTNWIFWFYEKNPRLGFNYRNNELYSISLRDPKNKRIEIKINE